MKLSAGSTSPGGKAARLRYWQPPPSRTAGRCWWSASRSRNRGGSATWVSAGHPARHPDRAAAAPGGQRARHARALPVPPGAPALLPGQELGEIKSWCSRVCPRHTSFPARGDSGSDGAPEKRGPPWPAAAIPRRGK